MRLIDQIKPSDLIIVDQITWNKLELWQNWPAVLFPQISSAACGYGFTLIASPTKDVIKLWGMGLNKDSQLGFQRTQHSRREMNISFITF